MRTRKIIQYNTDGTPFQEWTLSIKDGKVMSFSIERDGVVMSYGVFGSQIDESFFLSPPSRYIEEIELAHGQIEQSIFSHAIDQPAYWGWLVKIGERYMLIQPAGWYEVTDRMRDLDA